MLKNVICLFLMLLIGFTLSAQNESLPVKDLKSLYNKNEELKKTVDLMLKNVHDLPNGEPNPWKDKNVNDLYDFLNEWFYFLPNTHNGLDKILQFTFLYYKNPDGMKFVLSEPGLSWSNSFIEERGKFMDSPESAKIIEDWLSDNSLGNEDFVLPDEGFKSFNDFFTRDLKPGTRPIDDPTDNAVLVSPADGIINMIANELELDTEIPTKGRMTMSLNSLLDHSKYADKFVGGSAMAVFLMPDNYHHYHSPTTGKIVESKEEVGNRLFGMPNMLDMINNGNPGYNKDYSVFENFRHGYFIIQTNDYGFIAMVPIGLQTVGSVVFENDYKKVTSEKPIKIYKGEKLGHFAYGGSTVLLIFEKGKLNSMTVEQGQRIGKFKN
ncbi:phosphatidylserine decarboxylase [Portibacter marinus]|uniref:phosphatidylserine decarboxylase n=1 Tax=Portibacter marinus TaxID=2898660 RepID=UPI001F2FE2D4|nr:phosphatidylserine decarboxylase [Portibacter marinus]